MPALKRKKNHKRLSNAMIFLLAFLVFLLVFGGLCLWAVVQINQDRKPTASSSSPSSSDELIFTPDDARTLLLITVDGDDPQGFVAVRFDPANSRFRTMAIPRDTEVYEGATPYRLCAFAVAKTYYRELIEAGVNIYEFTPGFVHAKVFVSDDDTATVGTVNLDYRSLYLHFECGIFVYDNPVVHKIEKDFQETLKKSCKVTASDIGNTGIFMRICGRVLRLIAPLM